MAIRSDLTASHDRLWEQLAGPGTWLTGAERVAVAAELRAARRCALCIERKASLSPAAVSGEHEGPVAGLSPARRELIHKLVTDPGRITRSWAEGLLLAAAASSRQRQACGSALSRSAMPRFSRAAIRATVIFLRPFLYLLRLSSSSLELPFAASILRTTSFSIVLMRSIALRNASMAFLNSPLLKKDLPSSLVSSA